MPIVVCADCNKEMSDAAPACPHCARPNAGVNSGRSVGFGLGAGIFLLPLVFSWFTLRKGHTPRARGISFAWLAASLVLLGLQGEPKTAAPGAVASTATSTAEVAQAQIDNPSSVPAKAVDQKEHPTLGVTPEEFRVAFNQFVGQIDSSYRAAEFEVKSGDVNDVFTHAFAKNVAIVGSVNKSDGSMQSLIVTVAGQGEDIAKPIVVLLSAAHALNPNAPKEEISKAVLDLVKSAMANMDAGSSFDDTVGDLHYSAFASQYTGLMFTISSKEG